MADGAPRIEPFDLEAHGDAVLKLYHQVASYDGSMPRKTRLELMAQARHPHAQQASHFRVAYIGEAVVGATEVMFAGTKRTAITLAVHPAFRRRGVARALAATWPKQKRLLITTRASVEGATAALTSWGFTERHRLVRLRRTATALESLAIPSWATVETDGVGDAERLRRALRTIDGDDAETDLNTLQARLQRPRTRVIYVTTPNGDHGVCVVTAHPSVKKNALDDLGASTVGLVEEIRLAKAVQKKGLSRPLLREGLIALARDGFAYYEVTADKRRPAAVELYEREGFEIVDEDIFWIRRDDEA